MESKKNRTENWTKEEKSLLMECVNERKNLIECKSNDIKLLREKKSAWMEIKDVFRANGYNRDVCRIKEQWRRMKCAAKKNVSKYERERKRTGGGSPPQEPMDSDFIIKNICPDDFTRDTSIYDTDGYNRGEETVPVPATALNESEMVLDAETGLFLEKPQDSNTFVQTSSASISSALPPKGDTPKLKSKRKMSCYEVELLFIEKERHNLDMQHKTEIHQEVINQLLIERKRKQEELDAAIFKRKREELKYELLKEKINKNNFCE